METKQFYRFIHTDEAHMLLDRAHSCYQRYTTKNNYIYDQPLSATTETAFSLEKGKVFVTLENINGVLAKYLVNTDKLTLKSV